MLTICYFEIVLRKVEKNNLVKNFAKRKEISNFASNLKANIGFSWQIIKEIVRFRVLEKRLCSHTDTENYGL